MRTFLIAAAILLSLILALVVGYQAAAFRYNASMAEQRKEAKYELSLMLSMLSDIADHRGRGEEEIALWKFREAHGGLEEHIRGGGPPPSVFVLDIIETVEIPEEDPSVEDEEDESMEDKEAEVENSGSGG